MRFLKRQQYGCFTNQITQRFSFAHGRLPLNEPAQLLQHAPPYFTTTSAFNSRVNIYRSDDIRTCKLICNPIECWKRNLSIIWFGEVSFNIMGQGSGVGVGFVHGQFLGSLYGKRVGFVHGQMFGVRVCYKRRICPCQVFGVGKMVYIWLDCE